MQDNDQRDYLVDEWIKHADDDELNARSVLAHRDGTPAQVCFLAQQMSEKYLKALLLAQSGDYPKTHDLSQLIKLLSPYQSEISEVLKEEILLLEPYYVGTRYPADIPLESFTWTMAEESFEASVRIKKFVLEKIRSEENKGFGIVGILIIIAAVAVLGGGFLYFRELKRVENLTAPPPAPVTPNQQIQQPAPPATPAEIDTSTWKTYRNEKYGFEVRYPPSFTLFIIPENITGAGVRLFELVDSNRGCYMGPLREVGFEGIESQEKSIKTAQGDIGIANYGTFVIANLAHTIHDESVLYQISASFNLVSQGNSLILNQERFNRAFGIAIPEGCIKDHEKTLSTFRIIK